LIDGDLGTKWYAKMADACDFACIFSHHRMTMVFESAGDFQRWVFFAQCNKPLSHSSAGTVDPDCNLHEKLPYA
jgi:hypothetical protein